jgi:lactate dehydrogenase-like 2-hydroxyacid dehydrogenase
MRQFSAADRYVRAGRWPVDGDYPLTRQVSNKRIGIIGLGRIGSAIAKRLSAFGCVISYHNRHAVEGSTYTYVGSPAALAQGVDVLIVAVAGGAGTQGLVSRDVIEALGVDGYLVNIARGSVVDEQALVDALVGGRLAGAGLDVFEDEPHVPEALLTMDNVVVLPHVASGTVETRAAMEDLTLRNLASFLKTGQLVTPVPMPVSACATQ